jgi:hypothetical protein
MPKTLDLAARVYSDGEPIDGEVPPPAGTLKFRAWDLITGDRLTISLYRHYLESFYWYLMWTQTHYKGGKPVRVSNLSSSYYDFVLVNSWSTTRWTSSTRRRTTLILKTQSSPLLQDWLTSLHNLLSRAFSCFTGYPGYGEEAKPTPDELLTFENFMGALKRWESEGQKKLFMR